MDWIAPKCRYTIEGNTVRTDGTVKNKVTGTFLGGWLGVSPYKTPFSTCTELLGLWGEDGVGDKPAVITGKMLEGRIIDYLASQNPDVGTFYKAEDIFEAREGDHDKWASDFDDDVFAGHLDGVITRGGQDYILEIKTVNRRKIEKGEWSKQPPEHYLWQVFLYNHFITKQDKAYFGVGIVDENTYANPNGWVPSRSNCKLYEISIDQQRVAEVLEVVRAEYNQTVAKGTSFAFNPANPLDVEVMTHLTDLGGGMDNLNALITEYTTVKAENKAYADANKENLAREDELKDRIKTLMRTWDLSEANGVTLKRSTRVSFDFASADADGFDYSKYLKRTETISLR